MHTSAEDREKDCLLVRSMNFDSGYGLIPYSVTNLLYDFFFSLCPLVPHLYNEVNTAHFLQSCAVSVI